MKKKHYYGVIYISIVILPITAVYLTNTIIEFNLPVVQGITLGLSFLLCGEIDATYQSKKLIWAHISKTTRDKVAFTASLITFFILMAAPAWYEVILSLWPKLLWIIASVLIGLFVLVVLATPEFRGIILKRLSENKTQQGLKI